MPAQACTRKRPLSPAAADRRAEAQTLNSIGIAYSCLQQTAKAVEYFLKPENLDASPARFLDERNVRVDGRLSDFLDWRSWIGQRRSRLDDAADDLARHMC